jgi:predicted GNAT family N-acyltransferase
MTFLSTLLAPEHMISEFDCGKEPLNSWLKTQAARAQKSDTARTYVWITESSYKVLAYFSIAPTQVIRDELTSGQSGGLSIVPAFLLARLALDRTLHGQRLGTELLLDALQNIVRASETSAGRLIVVDAIDDEAARFYAHHDFVPVKGNPSRLVMKVATARNALGALSVAAGGDASMRLVSITFTMPDGSVRPVVASPEEADLLAEKLEEKSKAGEPVSLRAVFQEVLGRNPF